MFILIIIFLKVLSGFVPFKVLSPHSVFICSGFYLGWVQSAVLSSPDGDDNDDKSFLFCFDV